ncbi:hypothetical protein F2P81_001087 [Scophthalmus maximus]|uniref:Uncharacterized protein n=1 Tax=Scophthalmus maximus TaxID=52904 RepID=A0A6A4TWC3_SCOMX|nr:hypothetical protein F2P81_001087 [Scophthalmus maximus]
MLGSQGQWHHRTDELSVETYHLLYDCIIDAVPFRWKSIVILGIVSCKKAVDVRTNTRRKDEIQNNTCVKGTSAAVSVVCRSEESSENSPTLCTLQPSEPT